MHEIKIIHEKQVIQRMCYFLGRLSHYMFDKWKHKESKRHTHIKQWPYSQYPANIEIPDVDGTLIFFFPDQEVSNKKSTQYKKKVYTQVTVLKQRLNILVAGTPFYILENSFVAME